MANDTVLLQIEGPVARVTLNRPAVLNALDRAMAEGLRAAFERIEGTPELRAVILRGAGSAFMAGGDIREFEATLALPEAERRVWFERLIHEVHPVILAMRRLPLPVIAAAQGAVAGIGMSFLMAADLAVAAAGTLFTLAYCRLGTSPDGGATYFLPRHLGSKKAMEIALLGDRFDAETALRLGLVNEVVPADELAGRADALAARLSCGPRAAYAATKRLLNQSGTATIEAQLQAEAEAFARCATLSDFAEGVTAFLAKRPPAFG